MSVPQIYVATARVFADLVAELPADCLARPGLGEWTVRDLLGHTVSSGLVTVFNAVAQPAATEDVTTGEGYFALAKTIDPAVLRAIVGDNVAAARESGVRLGERPAAVVKQLADRAVAAVEAADLDALVMTSAGGMRLGAWLPTRTFELVVHGMDIAAAAGVKIDLPVDALAEAAALAARIAAVTGDGPQVLLALTGRRPLPDGFSVV